MFLPKGLTSEVQQVVRMLRIDPDNVTVTTKTEEVDAATKEGAQQGVGGGDQQRLVQAKITSMMRTKTVAKKCRPARPPRIL